MKTIARCAALTACLAWGGSWTVVQAQGEASEKERHAEEPSALWAWANFVMLAGGLGYLAAKHGGPWFVSRSQAIRRGIADAEEVRAKAEARAAEVDRKLAGLETEIASLRADAHREQASEAERIRQQAEADLARLKEHASNEIAAAGKAGRLELKRYAAQLAIDLAEQKIRRQLTPELQASLVDSFARNLPRPPAGSQLTK